MPIPQTVVEVGLDLSSVGGPFFTFGSSSVAADNPQSIFNNTTYRFGGTLFYDLTSKVTGVTITRGLSRELDRFVTGSANIDFVNRNRDFDPFYTSSPYYPDIRPRRAVKISSVVSGSTAVQFTGLIEDWDIDYKVSGEQTASAACVDGFILFGGQQLSAHTATSQNTGARIAAVLNRSEVAWPAALRDIDTGAQTLQPDIVEQGREVLEYLQLVAASEPGLLFMTKNNSVAFRNRNRAAAIGTVVFSDAGTAIPYTDIQISYGTELLYNRVSITPLGLDPQLATDSASQAAYGVLSLDLNGLLIQGGAQGTADALGLANFLVGKYSQPELRFESVSCELAALGTADQATVLGLELTNIVRLEYRPGDVGNRIVKDVQIIGIAHQIQPDRHKVTFTLASTDTAAFVFAGGTSTTASATYPFSVWAGGTFAGSPFGI